VGTLFITQISYRVLSRALGARLARLRPLARSGADTASGRPAVATAGSPALAPKAQPDPAPPQLVVKEPPRPKPGLAEKGLAWQESFDFAEGAARPFQLPAVGLLAPPPPSQLRRTREELEANAS